MKSKLRQLGNFTQQRAKRWRGIASPLKFIFVSTALRLTADKRLTSFAQILFDWMAIDLVWDRIKGFAFGVREQTGEPRIYENFEAMAKAQK